MTMLLLLILLSYYAIAVVVVVVVVVIAIDIYIYYGLDMYIDFHVYVTLSATCINLYSNFLLVFGNPAMIARRMDNLATFSSTSIAFKKSLYFENGQSGSGEI